MADTIAEWQKELRLLLDHIQSHPSHDLTRERDRIVVLNKLIVAHDQKVDA